MDTPREQAPTCEFCGHAFHHEDECEEVTGYDHMNGDHECGCPGTPPARDALAHLIEGIDYRQDTPDEIADRVIAGGWVNARELLASLADHLNKNLWSAASVCVADWMNENYPEETRDVF
jgi:hypothetical protein